MITVSARPATSRAGDPRDEARSHDTIASTASTDPIPRIAPPPPAAQHTLSILTRTTVSWLTACRAGIVLCRERYKSSIDGDGVSEFFLGNRSR
jgi:hypothetical protein